MPLPIYDSEAEVPEAMRPDYVAGADGKWRYKAEEDLEIERRKRTTLLDEKKEEERKRREAEAKLAEHQRAADARAKGVSEEELQRIRDEEAAARRPIEEERDKAKAEVRKLKLTDKVRALALKHGVMTDRLDDAMLVIDPRTDLGDEDGVVYKDAAGKLTAQSEQQFFDALKKEKPWFFEFPGGSGSGSSASNGSRREAAAKPSTENSQSRGKVMSAL